MHLINEFQLNDPVRVVDGDHEVLPELGVFGVHVMFCGAEKRLELDANEQEGILNNVFEIQNFSDIDLQLSDRVEFGLAFL